MDFENVKNLIENNYDIKVNNIIKRKNVYKIEANEGQYCLKVINYEFAHFYFILSAINHLRKNGFTSTPEIIKTINNNDYVGIDEKYAYLNPWIKVREADYKNIEDVKLAAKKLNELHRCSKGFVISENMKPRMYWGSWIKVFETRILEILDFKVNIERKFHKSDFDTIFLAVINKEIERAKKSIKTLKRAGYYSYMQEECKCLGFCHHDMAHHNILIDEFSNTNIIDFDYCILDSHLHDLASLCMRVMRNGLWSMDTFNKIVQAYDEKPLTKQEILIIAGFLEFPQDFWQIGLQYYWERLPWDEARFYGRLTNYIKDREMREKFINSLKERGEYAL